MTEPTIRVTLQHRDLLHRLYTVHSDCWSGHMECVGTVSADWDRGIRRMVWTGKYKTNCVGPFTTRKAAIAALLN